MNVVLEATSHALGKVTTGNHITRSLSKNQLSQHFDDFSVSVSAGQNQVGQGQKMNRERANLIKERLELGQKVIDSLVYLNDTRGKYEKINGLNKNASIYPSLSKTGAVKDLTSPEALRRKKRTRRVGRRSVADVSGSIAVKRWNNEKIVAEF